MLDPGEAVAGGAGAAEPSTSAFVAVPQPPLSISAPVASRTPDGASRRGEACEKD